jgi:hypothetical protein
VRGSTITLIERRAPWQAGGEWTQLPVARLRHDAGQGTWSLFWQRASGRWERYDAPVASDVAPLLGEVEADPDGVFWG